MKRVRRASCGVVVPGLVATLLVMGAPRAARATCIELGCTVEPLDAACRTASAPSPAGVPVRLRVTCKALCSAPGAVGSPHTITLDEDRIRAISFVREGCARAAPAFVAYAPDVCAQGRGVGQIVATDRALPPGRYAIAGLRLDAPASIVVDGATSNNDAACPTEADAVARNAEQVAWIAERQRQQELRSAEEERRAWQAEHPAGSSSQSHAVARASETPAPARGFFDDGDWQDRRVKARWTWELSAAATASLFSVRRSSPPMSDDPRRWTAGGVVSIGVRRFTRFDDEGILGRSSGLSWCAPVACMGIGAIFMPNGAWFGNERGIDLRVRLMRDETGLSATGSGLSGAVGIRPILRVSRQSRARTQSFVGVFVPEAGVMLTHYSDPQLYFSFHLFPVDVRLGRHLAVTWDGPVFGPLIPFGGEPVGLQFGTALGLTLLSGSD